MIGCLRSSFQPCPAGLLRHSVRRCAALGVLVSFWLVLQRGRSFQKRSFHPPTPARPDSVKGRGISSRVYRTVSNAMQGPIPTAPSLCLLRLSSAPSTGGPPPALQQEHHGTSQKCGDDVRPSHPRAIRQVGSWAPARLTVTAVTVSRQHTATTNPHDMGIAVEPLCGYWILSESYRVGSTDRQTVFEERKVE